MVEITDKKRMAIFAAYGSALVVTNSFVCRQVGLAYDTHELVLSATGRVITDSFISPVKDCRLSLVPLDRISDEDAIEVAKIMIEDEQNYEMYFHSDFYNSFRNDTSKEMEFQEERMLFMNNGNIHVIGLFSGKEIHCTPIICLAAYDYLRSKSYNCGYGEYTPKDLIDAGVVITETK